MVWWSSGRAEWFCVDVDVILWTCQGLAVKSMNFGEIFVGTGSVGWLSVEINHARHVQGMEMALWVCIHWRQMKLEDTKMHGAL